MLINLLKYGEDKGLPTIICTNLDLSSIHDRYGETVYSLIENSYSVEMLHEDMRWGSFKAKKSDTAFESTLEYHVLVERP